MRNDMTNILPLISIIVPIYNGEKYLTDFFKHYEDQTYPNLELVFVNDGSTDKTGDICHNYIETRANTSGEITLFNQQNRGVSVARNLGIEKSNGDYIIFIDIDDYIYPTYVEKLYYLIQKYNADMSCCAMIKVKENYNPKVYEKFRIDICAKYKKSEAEMCFDNNQAIEDFAYRRHVSGSPCCKLIKRNVIGQTRFKKELHYGEDYLFSYTLLKKCNRVAYIDSIEYLYIQQKSSATHIKKDNTEEFYKTWNMLMGVLEETAVLYPEANKGVREKCYMQAIKDTSRIYDKKKYNVYYKELHNFIKRNGIRIWKDKSNGTLNRILGLLGHIMPHMLCAVCSMMFKGGFSLRRTL